MRILSGKLRPGPAAERDIPGRRLPVFCRAGTTLYSWVCSALGRRAVGEGPDRPALQRRAQPFGSRVHFTGFVPHVQVPAVLRHVDMLVLPSRYEDLSSALIDAMAAGLPVAATRVGGTADLVHDGVNGLLVVPAIPPRSPPRSAGSSPTPQRPPRCRRPRGAPQTPTSGPAWPARCWKSTSA
jgi:hypothetical protein